MYTTCSELVVNNLLSYRGLVDARISASEKDFPVSGSISTMFLVLISYYVIENRYRKITNEKVLE